MRLLFVHGAGGFTEDRPLAEALAHGLGADLLYPEFSADDVTVEGWSEPLGDRLRGLEAGDALAAHSFGATVLLHLLATGADWTGPAHLLATPDWAPAGWDVSEFEFNGPEPANDLTLHHCADDEVVPIAHLDLVTAVLPSAQAFRYPTGGHQFEGRSAELARVFCGSTHRFAAERRTPMS